MALKKLYMNIVVEDEVMQEGQVGSKSYNEQENCLFNADAAIALYSFLKSNCLEWEAKDVVVDYFEDDDSGFAMTQYSGNVVWKRDGNSSDLIAQFYGVRC